MPATVEAAQLSWSTMQVTGTFFYTDSTKITWWGANSKWS